MPSLENWGGGLNMNMYRMSALSRHNVPEKLECARTAYLSHTINTVVREDLLDQYHLHQ